MMSRVCDNGDEDEGAYPRDHGKRDKNTSA